MSDPKSILAQLLSPAQAEALSLAGAEAWESAAGSLELLLAGTPGLASAEARLVMPDEIVGEFADPHLVLPVELSTAKDQSANAYVIAGTGAAAAFFDSEADDPGDQEQQTIIMASTIAAQLIQAMNAQVFGRSPDGLVVSLDDVAVNAMPELLEAMDDPALLLTLGLEVGKPLSLRMVLPGTFLDIFAGAMPVMTAAEPEPAAAPKASAIDPSLGFTLSEDDLDAAELIEDPQPIRAAAFAAAPMGAEPVGAGAGIGGGSAAFSEPPPREPTPISAAPASHRARFAPLPEAEPARQRSPIDMLAGLRMNVSVELGRTELTVAEVLGLGPGSVIELDRLAGEPVDILVNDRLIARGEVVVVDENFGVRVVEVVRRGKGDED
ncbi:MAG: flagellar motor switch protein FliN [Dehalococcoidia bacterium]|nr:flagellar motor switch protein FliN [Dehalococcoidia bacterium]